MTDRFGPLVDFEAASFIHESALLFGKITLMDGASIWPNAVLRAECQEIRVGRFTNIQDHVMIHIGYQNAVTVGDYCSIAHRATLHGCTIGDHCLIGINATIMDGCVIGRNSIVAGHSFLREGTIIPDNSIVMGSPGSVKRERDCALENVTNALLYHANARAYRAGDHRVWAAIDHDALKMSAQAYLAQCGQGAVGL